MKSFEQKARDYYGEVTINKGLMGKAGFGARAIPVYVGEWIISQFMEGDRVVIQNVFEDKGQGLRWTGYYPERLMQRLKQHGITLPPKFFTDV